MILPPRILLALALLVPAPPDALAQSDSSGGDTCRSEPAADWVLSLTCEQTPSGTKTRLVFDTREDDKSADTVCASHRRRVFESASGPEARVFTVAPGQSVECAYSSGRTVRVKAGVDGWPYTGECSADPETYFSIWVDHRKLASRVPYAGRCRWLDADPSPSPIDLYRITDTSIEECALPELNAAEDAPGKPACRRIHNLAMHAPDEREYPEPGRIPPKPGTVALVDGKGAVCEMARALVGRIWRNETQSIADDDMGVKWLERTREPPLAFSLSPLFGRIYESEFDLDNDGVADRVFSSQADDGGTYWIPLLVQEQAKGPASMRKHRSVDESFWSLPCQLNARHFTLTECRGAANYSGLRVPGYDDSDDTLDFFRAQYARLRPFRHGNETYVAVTSVGLPSRDYAAVVKPLPGRHYETTCLFHRIPENF